MKCGIIGNPLNKPRSIKIWSNYFIKKNIKASMEAYDIKRDNFKTFISNLTKSKNTYAFAITMPYKITILKYCYQLDESAKIAKSANLIIKNKQNNQFKGYNTDVLGAYATIKKYINEYKIITIIGMGGAGTSIYNYLKFKHPNLTFNIITSKKKKYREKDNVNKKINNKILRQKSLIINCTPLGSNLNETYVNQTPIEEIYFKILNKNSLIFDIIYQPSITLLKKYSEKFSIDYINGKKMINFQGKEALKLSFE